MCLRGCRMTCVYVCVCVCRQRKRHKKNPAAEKVAAVGREQSTRVCVFIHNSWSDVQGAFQRAVMRCINTHEAAHQLRPKAAG